MKINFKKVEDKFGAELNGGFFYWNATLSQSAIFLNRLRRQVNKLINFSAALVGAAGLLSLAYYFYQNFQTINSFSLAQISFLIQTPSVWILLFLFSILVDTFLFYRLTEEEYQLGRIKNFSVDDFGGDKIAVDLGFSTNSLIIVENAYELAEKLKQSEVNPRHLFWVLLRNNKVRTLFSRLNVDYAALVDKLKRHLLVTDPASAQNLILSEKTQEVLIQAYLNAYNDKRRAVDVLDLLDFCYNADDLLGEILFDCEISQEKLVNAIAWFRSNDKVIIDRKIFREMARLKPGSSMDRAYTALSTPTLDYFSEDLTLRAKYNYFGICLNRDKEIKDIFDTFASGCFGALLVGSVGVGKRTIVEGIAQLMVKEDVPEIFKDKRLVELDAARLIGGVSAAEAEERLMTIISEIVHAKNVILFVDNISAITGISSGGDGSLDLAQVFANLLTRGNVYCLATISPENYAEFVEGSALGNAMPKIEVREPDHNSAIQMLQTKVAYFESKYGIYFDYDAIASVVELSARYVNDKFLPEKAIDILRLAAVRVANICKHDKKHCFCSQDDVADIIAEFTGVPVARVGEKETEKLLNLEASIHQRMIGQEEAVNAISGSLRRARAEMREGKRPIASFLFLGPTGVGKTELAKTVAEVYFGDEKNMVRLDMSEYQMSDSVVKMIGDSAGNLGYLTEAVRHHPFSLILFDEIEKANPDVLNLFLQLMDDGRLTDGSGRTIDFTNAIIVATSNAGALYIEEAVETGVDINIIKQEIIDNQLNKFMRPELINRFDGVIVFKPLSFANVVEIAKLMLNKIGRSLEEKGIVFAPTQSGVERLAQLGYDPKFGARPLRRLLQDRIENEVANLLLAKKIRRRDTIIVNDKGELEVGKANEL
ncbi:MAG: ATP-dependent Clp protease ATP-binding subunit [Candidatus Falkowbacteria bacterium]